jgi:hypothetical protein
MVSSTDAPADAHCYTWRPDPDRYIRPVKGGRYQARPHDTFTGERENLGTFGTRAQARVAVQEFWAGKRKGKPKFVRRCDTKTGARFFIVLPTPSTNGKRKWQRVGGWYESEDEAAEAVRTILTASFGPIVAAAMLSRRDTSTYGKGGKPRPNATRPRVA